MRQRIGTCSLCGGDVMGDRGAWHSVLPPPPDECTSCGAVARGQSDVIEMVPTKASMRSLWGPAVPWWPRNW